jgi:hypothetical protein
VALATLGSDGLPPWRLNLLRFAYLVFVVTFPFGGLPHLFHHSPTDRGMITAILGGLWVMAILGLRYPLKMLPVMLFEFTWKAIWLCAYGLPQWVSGLGAPGLRKDLLEIGTIPFLLALVIPWHYVWRHFVRQPMEQWR